MKALKQFGLGLMILAFTANGADTGLDPASLEVKLYKFAVSSSVLCTNPITVYENDNPEYKNVFQNPDFGAGSLIDGTYPCVVMEMSDNIRTVAAENSDSGNCVANGEAVAQDVCSSGTSTLADGTSVTCNSEDNRVAIYLSTTSLSTGGDNADPFTPPNEEDDANNGFNLGSALIVSGTAVGTFVVDGSGKLEDSGSECDMQPPAFSFSQ